jgi:hypothetical protein
MDSLNKNLQVGKYYRLETGQNAQYTGLNNSRKHHLFEWKNPLGNKIVLLKHNQGL